MLYKKYDYLGVIKSMHIYYRKLEKIKKHKEENNKSHFYYHFQPTSLISGFFFFTTHLYTFFYNWILLSSNVSTSGKFCLRYLSIYLFIHLCQGHILGSNYKLCTLATTWITCTCMHMHTSRSTPKFTCTAMSSSVTVSIPISTKVLIVLFPEYWDFLLFLRLLFSLSGKWTQITCAIKIKLHKIYLTHNPMSLCIDSNNI